MGKSEYSFLLFQINDIHYLIAVEYVVRIYGMNVKKMQKELPEELPEDIPIISIYSQQDNQEDKVMIVLQCDQIKFGICVDYVNEVLRLQLDSFYKLPDHMKDSNSRYVAGIIVDEESKQLQYVINIEELVEKISDKEDTTG